jgi:hypothetical protein
VKARAVDLKIFHYALNIVGGFGEGDALDPVDGIDVRVARIAMLGDPLLNPSAPGIVPGKRQDIGARQASAKEADLRSEVPRRYSALPRRRCQFAPDCPLASVPRIFRPGQSFRTFGSDAHPGIAIIRDVLAGPILFMIDGSVGMAVSGKTAR